MRRALVFIALIVVCSGPVFAQLRVGVSAFTHSWYLEEFGNPDYTRFGLDARARLSILELGVAGYYRSSIASDYGIMYPRGLDWFPSAGLGFDLAFLSLSAKIGPYIYMTSEFGTRWSFGPMYTQLSAGIRLWKLLVYADARAPLSNAIASRFDLVETEDMLFGISLLWEL